MYWRKGRPVILRDEPETAVEVDADGEAAGEAGGEAGGGDDHDEDTERLDASETSGTNDESPPPPSRKLQRTKRQSLCKKPTPSKPATAVNHHPKQTDRSAEDSDDEEESGDEKIIRDPTAATPSKATPRTPVHRAEGSTPNLFSFLYF